MVRCTSFIRATTQQSGDKWKLKFSYDVFLEIQYKGQTKEHKVGFEMTKHDAVELQKKLNYIGHLIWWFIEEVNNAEER